MNKQVDVLTPVEQFVKSSANKNQNEIILEKLLKLGKAEITEFGNAILKYRKDLELLTKPRLRAGDYVALFFSDAIFNRVLVVETEKKKFIGVLPDGKLFPTDIDDALFIGLYRKDYLQLVKQVR